MNFSYVDWTKNLAAIWRGKTQYLRPVKDLDLVCFDDLLNVARQKNLFQQNLNSFLAGNPANHTLLWGGRGTGKSSLVKAALNHYADQGLRLIEIDKQDIADLPEITDYLRELDYKFLIYSDDLSFVDGDANFRHFKVLMEGSIEAPPKNILMVATSNRRHLVGEKMANNLSQQRSPTGEIHPGEAQDETLSLADRFGLSLGFYPPNQAEYLALVDQLFAKEIANKNIELDELHKNAINFATARGGRSGRVARQFFIDFSLSGFK